MSLIKFLRKYNSFKFGKFSKYFKVFILFTERDMTSKLGIVCNIDTSSKSHPQTFKVFIVCKFEFFDFKYINSFVRHFFLSILVIILI